MGGHIGSSRNGDDNVLRSQVSELQFCFGEIDVAFLVLLEDLDSFEELYPGQDVGMMFVGGDENGGSLQVFHVMNESHGLFDRSCRPTSNRNGHKVFACDIHTLQENILSFMHEIS